MMAISAFWYSLLLFPISWAQEPKVEINVYEGPKDCAEKDKIACEKYVALHYRAKIDDSSDAGEPGKEFDTSHERGEPTWVRVCMGEIIQGWDEGLVGICKGAKVEFIIPPELALGANANGHKGVPPGATLNYDCEILSVRDEEPEDNSNVWAQLDTNKDNKLTHAEVLAYFKAQGQDEVPEAVFQNEDKDQDGIITWEEFGGPKGDAPFSAEEEETDDLVDNTLSKLEL